MNLFRTRRYVYTDLKYSIVNINRLRINSYIQYNNEKLNAFTLAFCVDARFVAQTILVTPTAQRTHTVNAGLRRHTLRMAGARDFAFVLYAPLADGTVVDVPTDH